jgi:hypothetical protein
MAGVVDQDECGVSDRGRSLTDSVSLPKFPLGGGIAWRRFQARVDTPGSHTARAGEREKEGESGVGMLFNRDALSLQKPHDQAWDGCTLYAPGIDPSMQSP